MQIFFTNDTTPPHPRALATIGTFDGVHRGHLHVLKTLTDWRDQLHKKGEACDAGIITFRDHPRKTLDGRAPDMLTTLEHRLVLFERAGLDFAWVLDFTPELSKLTARAFAELYFRDRLKLRGLVMGHDSRFGSDRMSKDSPGMEALAKEIGCELRAVEPVLSPESEIISSTRIREAILEGRLQDAEAMLGRHVSVYGTVIHGDGRGRRLGYHTANIDLGREVRPPFGVYATVSIVNGKRCGSVTNVGYRPTIAQNLPPGAKPDLLIESHLFEFDGDLYGQKMEVLFVEKLRDERRFSDVVALVDQIKKDENKARAILQARGMA
jgi:riboflavin kinase / FMN adenylyltransferase